MTPRKDCLKCSRFLTCRDPKKAPRHSCEQFAQIKGIASMLELEEMEIEPEGESPSALEVNIKKRLDGPVILPETADELKEYSDLDAEQLNENGPDLEADFVWRAMRKAFDPDTNMVRDLKIDDSDMRLADNYFDFCTKVAGKSIKTPFSRQAWIAYNLLSEYCPICTPSKYSDINNVPVDMDPMDLVRKVTLLKRGRCPKCKRTKSEMIASKDLIAFNQLVMVAGQRGGKSAFSSTISGYHTHMMLKAPRLSTICPGIQDFTPLTGTFVALTTGRAIKLQWNPFHTIVTTSEWFGEYFKLLDEAGKKYSKEFYKLRGLFLSFYHKNLDYYPMGPMKRTLRGDTRIFANTDELGWFPYKASRAIVDGDDEDALLEDDADNDEREMADGNEVHQALDNSLSTVRAEVYNLYKKNINTVPTGLNILISSPKSWQDKICRLLKESENPAALSFGIRLPTWGINPFYTRDHPVITSAYAKNARRADRDFGANPPRIAENAFNKVAVRESFRGKQHHEILLDEEDPYYTVGRVRELIVRSRWRANVLAIDAGFINNSFSMALGSRDQEKIVVHTALELLPSRAKPVNFPRVYKDILLPIIKECNVLYFVADRWNSINLLQQASDDTGGRCKFLHLSVNEGDFKEYQHMVNSGNLILPKTKLDFTQIEEVVNFRKDFAGKPLDHLYHQFTTVQNLNGMIVKGEGFTDDIFRAVTVLVTAHFTPRVREYLIKEGAKDRETVSNRAVVMIGGRSGGALYVPQNAPARPPDESYYD